MATMRSKVTSNEKIDPDVLSLINKITEMTGNSLLEKILDYCETYNVDIQEVGDKIAKFEEFKNLLYKDCVKHHIINDPKFQFGEDIEEW